MKDTLAVPMLSMAKPESALPAVAVHTSSRPSGLPIVATTTPLASTTRAPDVPTSARVMGVPPAVDTSRIPFAAVSDQTTRVPSVAKLLPPLVVVSTIHDWHSEELQVPRWQLW